MAAFLKDNKNDAADSVVAHAMGMTEDTYSKLLSGKNNFVMPGTVKKVCRYYEISLDEINKRYGENNTEPKQTKMPSYDFDPKKLGAFYKYHRLRNLMTPEEIGSKVTISASTIKKIEKGNIKSPLPRDYVGMLCKEFNLSAKDYDDFDACLQIQNHPKYFAEFLAKKIEESGFSDKALRSRTGLTLPTVQSLKIEKPQLPQAKTIKTVAKVLGFKITDLTDYSTKRYYEDNPPSKKPKGHVPS